MKVSHGKEKYTDIRKNNQIKQLFVQTLKETMQNYCSCISSVRLPPCLAGHSLVS